MRLSYWSHLSTWHIPDAIDYHCLLATYSRKTVDTIHLSKKLVAVCSFTSSLDSTACSSVTKHGHRTALMMTVG